jgi:type II secretory ATPase GspE/PulE/Tfp pilus assembly ATPase PilB-like protein
MNSTLLLSWLRDSEMLDQKDVDLISREVSYSKCSAYDLLLDQNWFSEDELMHSLSDYFGLPIVSFSGVKPSNVLLSFLHADVAQARRAIPFDLQEDALWVATSNPFDRDLSTDLHFITQRPVKLGLTSPRELEGVLQRCYAGAGAHTFHSYNLDLTKRESAAVEAVHSTLSEAVQAGASDVHFEPFENALKVRYRVDGVLREAVSWTSSLARSVLCRLKLMANLDIAHGLTPQDGRIQTQVQDKSVHLRVSTLPTRFGESVVVRLLDQEQPLRELEQIGLPQSIFEAMGKILRRPYGMLLTTGPTGSGKTTTLYAALRKLKNRKVITIEDPVEYDIDGAQQIAACDNIGLTFPRALRSMLRHDPDVILVGEIRDAETARVSVQAALTGHLLLSSLHTTDAPSAVTRLLDLGVEPYLISSSLQAVLAQRLVKKLCPHCRERVKIDSMTAERFGLNDDVDVYFSTGCEHCQNSGHEGRRALFEWMPMSESLAKLIQKRASAQEIRERVETIFSFGEHVRECLRRGEISVEPEVINLPVFA